ncbi:hypothetical protein NKH77_05825 [Streptomyces sp. M19]
MGERPHARPPDPGRGPPGEDGDPFWQLVRDQDVAALADTLGVADPAPVAALVPALASWHDQRQANSTVDGWRYRVGWHAVPGGEDLAPPGSGSRSCPPSSPTTRGWRPPWPG